MASLQAKVDAVKAAVSSTTSCTPAAVVTLKELLLPEPESQPPKPKSRSTKAGTATKTKSSAGSDGENLSSRERAALATHIINVTLKTLSEAAKPLPSSTQSKQNGDLREDAGRQSSRRSSSSPLSPAQPRALNRLATSANVEANQTKSQAPAQSTGCLATVECARIAFSALRAIKGPTKPDEADFQLETGMSALTGKLLALGMHDQALKELRVLKRRLDSIINGAQSSSAKSGSEITTTTSAIADLLNFNGSITKNSLATITGYQMQVLKLIAATKKPSHIEVILPYLADSYTSSPFNLLSTLAKEGAKEAAKAARQMASLSQVLLSLAPSISSQEDAVATEPRLSPSPDVAFELQSLAFRIQLKWWKLAGHKGNIDNDVVSPFSRCLRAFTRRQKLDKGSVYQTASESYDTIMQLIHAQKYRPATSFDSPLASIHQILGSAAQAERRYTEAHRWFQELKSSLTPGQESSVLRCSVSARLLAVALKKADMDHTIELLLCEVIDGLDGSLSGTIAELNELLESLSLARRSVVGLLMTCLGPNAGESTVPSDLVNHLKTFVLKYPRFVRRWTGLPPNKDASSKQVLQFDQRRQLVAQSIGQTLDATLMVIKCDIQSDASGWQAIDDVLQHCVSLLDCMNASTLSTAKIDNLGTYAVKISSLYFSIFSQLRKKSSRSKEENKHFLRALHRSIDVVKDCNEEEKEKAQLSTKIEMFADLCKTSGRTEDAVQTMRYICSSMAENGVLADVAAALDTQSPSLAWSMNDRVSLMSRTLRSMSKIDSSWNEWTFPLPEAERAAVLEHMMRVGLTSSSASSQPLGLYDAGVAALLRIYTLEKHPVRRLRVLLHLCYQNLGEEEQLAKILSLAEETWEYMQTEGNGEDDSLAHFIPHMQAYCTSIGALIRVDRSMSTLINEAIDSWKSMIGTCETQDELFTIIDDPQGLLDHLHSLHQLAGLKGETRLQLAISELNITLSRVFVGSTEASGDGLVLSHSQLAAQYVNIGLFPQALKTIVQTQELLSRYDGLSRQVLAEFYLSQAEYHTGIGDMDTAKICNSPYSSWARSKSHASMVISLTSLLQSIVTLQAGDIQEALSLVKTSVRMLTHNWTKLEAALEADQKSVDMSLSDINNSSTDLMSSKGKVAGPRFWTLASPLIRSLLHISSVYAHIGMFQETVYYAESAWKIAESTQSSLYKAQVAIWTGSVYLKAGKLPKALTTFQEAEEQLPRDTCSARVRFARQLGEFYWEIGEDEKAAEFLKMAEETARLLSTAEDEYDSDTAEEPAAEARTMRSTRSTKTKAPAAPKPSKRVTAKSKAATAADIVQLPKDIYYASLHAAIILSRTLGLIYQKDWSSALQALEQLKDLPKLVGVLSQEQVMMAESLIGHSMEQMISDPVFSVMQDSTISFPAVSTMGLHAAGGLQKNSSDSDSDSPAFADALKKAQELLIEAHASALSSSDSSMVRRISALLQSTVIFLSATLASKSLSESGLGTVAVDIARNVTWQREQQTLAGLNNDTIPVRVATPVHKPPTMEAMADMTNFQENYVDLIPKKWSVISISLSDNRHDLCITKFQAGQGPFILRLPLERANSRDADSEVFNFEHGREELLELIKLANESSHSARDFTAKGERGAWWAERQALDSRLKKLLVTIETTWLGGFKGMFSQHRKNAELLARFQRDFHQMLDRMLPSRNKARGKKTAVKTETVTLDPRILDLFIGLGDPTEPDVDFDEALNDLLYFVVDILQFHGERNAYDEIDFDGMVLETYDALRGYHNAANSTEREEGAHTVLVLDKLLHAFPWESMPCMDGLSVSRVPSLACLRQLIREAGRNPARKSHGHFVSAKAGMYILNPSSDLTNTQTFFQPAFSGLSSWSGIINKAPKESEFERALATSEIMVYFGHGSGAQYIRGKTIRRLEKCRPTTFLMGCSSAALTDAGEFESYGPVWNYMMAGCPAVVGTLWDVTDRDIDRFAGKTFEEWGLFARGTFDGATNKGKGKARSFAEEIEEAVATARNACRFKYLNGAAVVLYGIPVYIKKD
ncbi:peptidase family c50 domain-containing protein [Trichoderma breve]|uniref:separase n=1 Tax=Trichoderma breve TaxID=2034170 RepID=A0A9W9BCU7_9HYPO|nr:peptidase family c50 domain-containing protein [Trichoderma breve]KAJ4857231.1 peptidase family c50 domain-containing protein [Trichoderma breve]